MHHWRFQNKIYSVDVPMCSSSHSSIFTVRNFKCSTFYREKTKKLCLQCKCQDPMNSLALHQTSECQYSASILRRRHKSENVVKFCYFDMTLLCKVYIIQLLRTLYFWKINFNYYQKLSHAFFWAELPLSARVGHSRVFVNTSFLIIHVYTIFTPMFTPCSHLQGSQQVSKINLVPISYQLDTRKSLK